MRAPRSRLLAVGGTVALVLLVVLGLARPWDGPGGPRIVAVFDAVPGLVEGAEVRRAGVEVGRVTEIGLEDDRPRVVLRLHDGETLHRGATADLRMVSLSGQLNRVVSVTDGRGAPLPDGATLGLARTDAPVEVEQVLNALDPDTRRAVRRIVRGTHDAVAGRGGALAGTLRQARRALVGTASAVGDLQADGAALRRVATSTARVTGTLAAAPGATGAAVDRLAAVLADTAAEQSALGRTLVALPAGLRAPRATLERLRRQVPRLRATVADAAPAARAVRALAPELRTTLASAGPPLRDLRAVTADGPAQLAAVRPLVTEATPLLRALGPALARTNPMLDEARARLPDAFSFFANWADFTSAYDGNGHGARVGIVLPPAPNRTASPTGQDAGQLARPFLRTPGSLEDGASWTDHVASFASKDVAP